MSLSLRDQLLAAGLIDPKKAKQAGKEQHHQRREQAKRPPAAPDPRVVAEQKAREAKLARDAELNRQQQDRQEQKARRAAVKQLVEQHRVPKVVDSEELYNFLDGTRIRRIPVDRPLREKLVKGQLVIVRCDGRYEIVPADIGQRIGERDPHALVRQQAQTKSEPAPDDPYKDYVVPDDLMW